MNDWPRLNKLVHKLLHRKPVPLRQGKHGPFIFVHINKTAGTSVGRAIGLPVKDHLMATEIIERIGRQAWDAAYKFTVVRNPWDKVVSHYEYRRKKDKTGIATGNIGFTDWVRMTYGPDKDTFYYNNPRSFQPQVDWLKDADGLISMDYIIRFESLREDFEHVRQQIGLDTELPHLNASKRSGYHAYYDGETRETVARWFREDIEAFGYEF
jgi:hypothetical protein